MTVIGVVADAHINGLKDDAAMVYLPYWAFTPWTLSFLVRSSAPGDAMIPEMRRVIWQDRPAGGYSHAPARSTTRSAIPSPPTASRPMVLTSFGAAALLLALLGVYGVLAYSVSLRGQEFGIRIALGSGKRALIALVLRQASQPVLLGLAIGLAFALFALRWIHSLFYQAAALDPVAIASSVLLLLAAAAVAAIVPARRAASTDPMRTLRMD